MKLLPTGTAEVKYSKNYPHHLNTCKYCVGDKAHITSISVMEKM